MIDNCPIATAQTLAPNGVNSTTLFCVVGGSGVRSSISLLQSIFSTQIQSYTDDELQEQSYFEVHVCYITLKVIKNQTHNVKKNHITNENVSIFYFVCFCVSVQNLQNGPQLKTMYHFFDPILLHNGFHTVDNSKVL